jgi:hypothetical protein
MVFDMRVECFQECHDSLPRPKHHLRGQHSLAMSAPVSHRERPRPYEDQAEV